MAKCASLLAILIVGILIGKPDVETLRIGFHEPREFAKKLGLCDVRT